MSHAWSHDEPWWHASFIMLSIKLLFFLGMHPQIFGLLNAISLSSIKMILTNGNGWRLMFTFCVVPNLHRPNVVLVIYCQFQTAVASIASCWCREETTGWTPLWHDLGGQQLPGACVACGFFFFMFAFSGQLSSYASHILDEKRNRLSCKKQILSSL